MKNVPLTPFPSPPINPGGISSAVGRSSPGASRQFLLSFLLGLLLLPGLLPAQTNAPKPAPGRYLFIVDSSARMRRCATGVRTAVGSLLRSSMGAQFNPGDTVGVWTFNDQLHAGRFPLQTWTPEATDRIASNIVSFLKAQTNGGQSRFEAVLPTLQRLVEDSPRLTVLLVSDGDERISGTPFDKEIEGALAGKFKAQQKAKMPFITVLRAARGRFVTATVNLAPWPVEFPIFPPEPKPVARAKPPEPKPEPRPAVPPLIIIGKKPEPPTTTDTAAATITNAPPTSESPPPKPALPISPTPTNPPTTSASPTNMPVRTGAGTPPATANLELTEPVPPAASPVVTTTNLPPSVANTESPQSSPNLSTATEKYSDAGTPTLPEPSPATNPPAILVAAKVESGYMRWALIGAGTLLVLMAAGTILLLQRRSQNAGHGSLISRSMERDKK